MSAVERWNGLAEDLFAWGASAASMSAVLFVVAGIAWSLLRRRASAHLGHVLFLVPLVPLVLPRVGNVELPAWAHPGGGDTTTFGTEAEPLLAPALELTGGGPVLDFGRPTDGGEALVSPSRTVPRAPGPTWKAWTLLFWALAVSFLLSRLAVVQWRMHRHLGAARSLGGPQGERVRARLARLAPRLGLRRTIRVVETDAVPTPAVWGLRRPVLALEGPMVAGLGDEELDWVLLHELAHLERLDLVRGTAQRLVQVLWFFHPLVWLATRTADELREAACDETAMAVAKPSRPIACARALVEVAAHRVPRTRRALLLTLQEDKTKMKKRILRMLDPTRVPTRGSSLAGLAFCCGLVSTALVEVSFAQKDVPVAEQEVIEIFEEIEEVPDQGLRDAISSSLEWLLAQQAGDGHWPTGPDTEAASGEFNSIGVTGLVMLALDEAQEDERLPGRGRAIERARGYLAGVQREDGLFGKEHGFTFMQSHAVATLAWLKTRPGGEDDAWKPAAERAIEVILRARNPYMGWRFGLRPTGDCDTFTTGLMLAALHQAREAGIDVPEGAWKEPLEFIDQVTEPSNGRTGYDSRGGNDARLAVKGDEFPAELTQLSTAMAIVTRMQWGTEPRASDAIRRGSFLLGEFEPRWDEEAGSIDYYYWLFGTRALAPIGGAQYDHWREAVVAALVPNQVVDAEGGWWPAIDAWSSEGARVHSTAVCTLALQSAL